MLHSYRGMDQGWDARAVSDAAHLRGALYCTKKLVELEWMRSPISSSMASPVGVKRVMLVDHKLYSIDIGCSMLVGY